MRIVDADEIVHEANKCILLALSSLTDNRRKAFFVSTCKLIKDTVEDAPTVDAVSVRHGKWVAEKYNDNLYVPCCSECNVSVTLTPCKLKFCPNCGAKMDRGDDNATG